MTSYRMIGVDPGKTTGVCIFYVNDETNRPEMIGSYELDFNEFGDFLYLGCHRVVNVHTYIACEAFIIHAGTAKKTQAPWSLEAIGVARYYAYFNQYSFSLQAPASAKRMISNDVLKNAGLYVPGGHAKDAARHALYACITDLGLLTHTLKGGEDVQTKADCQGEPREGCTGACRTGRREARG